MLTLHEVQFKKAVERVAQSTEVDYLLHFDICLRNKYQ
jgi:hypothetical protein